MIFSQYANNNLRLAPSRTSPGIANTCLLGDLEGSRRALPPPCKFPFRGGLPACLPACVVLCITTTSSTFSSQYLSCSWLMNPALVSGELDTSRILLWYNLELQTTGKWAFVPLAPDYNNRLRCIFLRASLWTSVCAPLPSRRNSGPHHEKKYKKRLLSALQQMFLQRILLDE